MYVDKVAQQAILDLKLYSSYEFSFLLTQCTYTEIPHIIAYNRVAAS